MLIQFFRKSFDRRFSFYDRFNIGRIAGELSDDVEMVFDTDTDRLAEADVVIFDVPFAMQGIVSGRIPVFEDQVLVGWCMECEENYPWLKNPYVRSFFDIWMTYHPDSDIAVPYYDADYPVRLSRPVRSKSRNVCMFISSTVNSSGRQEYLLELMKHVDIDSYGLWQNNARLLSDDGYRTKMEVMKDYRFTIAFENAIADDYVTEKFYEPLLSGSVPVYLGAPNIDRFAPSRSSFIDVRDYDGPEHLAHAINEYCRDEMKYSRLFEWKNEPVNEDFRLLAEAQKTHPFLRLIDLINSRYKQ